MNKTNERENKNKIVNKEVAKQLVENYSKHIISWAIDYSEITNGSKKGNIKGNTIFYTDNTTSDLDHWLSNYKDNLIILNKYNADNKNIDSKNKDNIDELEDLRNILELTEIHNIFKKENSN